MHERQLRFRHAQPLLDEGSGPVRLAREQPREHPARRVQLSRPGPHFPGGRKELRVVHVPDRIQVRARGRVVAAVGARAHQANGDRQVIGRETPRIGEHRHLAFGIAPRRAGVGELEELRRRRRMHAGPVEVAPLDPRACQALLEDRVIRRGRRRLLEHRDRFVAAPGRKQRIGKVAQLAA